jgi:hypothetical protein
MLQTLDLSDNEILCPSMLIATLIPILPDLHHLKNVNLSSTVFKDTDVTRLLLRLLALPCLQSLKMEHGVVGDIASYSLGRAVTMCQELQSLDVSQLQCSYSVQINLLGGVASCSSLREISVNLHWSSEYQLQKLASSIREAARRLKKIHLKGIELCDEKVLTFAEALVAARKKTPFALDLWDCMTCYSSQVDYRMLLLQHDLNDYPGRQDCVISAEAIPIDPRPWGLRWQQEARAWLKNF